MKNIKISVIIPCYNGWRYMDKCLRALEKQTVQPFEVVVADDCSTDDSYDRLMEYAQTSKISLKVIKNEKNSGPGVSRRNAIAVAEGNYLAFCDCDDWYEDTFIEEMSRAIKTENADIVICDNFTTYDDRKIPCHVTTPLVGADRKTTVVLYAASLCRLAVKKELFDNVYCPPIYHMEDGAIVPQLMAKAEKIAIVDKPLYNYYFRENSASNKPSKRVFKDILTAFEAVEAIKDKYPKECEFLGIKIVCYGATLNGFKAGIKTKEIASAMAEFTRKYPHWTKNKYLSGYNKFKRVYLKLLSMHLYPACRAMASLHFIITKNKRG